MAQYKEYKAGEVFSFRFPTNTDEYQLNILNKVRQRLGNRFGKEMAPIFLDSVMRYAKSKESVSVPLPQKLTKAQREKFNDPHVRHLIGQVVYQLVTKPHMPIEWMENDHAENNDPKPKGFAETFAENNLLDDL